MGWGVHYPFWIQIEVTENLGHHLPHQNMYGLADFVFAMIIIQHDSVVVFPS